eukprot:365187-Chlamydomonas_euryale.AAC.16
MRSDECSCRNAHEGQKRSVAKVPRHGERQRTALQSTWLHPRPLQPAPVPPEEPCTLGRRPGQPGTPPLPRCSAQAGTAQGPAQHPPSPPPKQQRSVPQPRTHAAISTACAQNSHCTFREYAFVHWGIPSTALAASLRASCAH